MTLQLLRYTDAALMAELTRYQQTIAADGTSMMLPHWLEAVAQIEHEIEQRHLLASSAANRRTGALID